MNDDLNIYRAPQADLHGPLAGFTSADDQRFYVVSARKFLIMFFATFGIYSTFWFYRNFKLNKAHQKNDDWPVPRAIFPIFFSHGLFEAIDYHIKHRAREHDWDPRSTATLFVISSILTNVFDRLANKNVGSPTTDMVAFVGLGFMAFFLVKAQAAINAACLSDGVDRNDTLSIANFAWILVGGLFWCAVIYALYMTMTGRQI